MEPQDVSTSWKSALRPTVCGSTANFQRSEQQSTISWRLPRSKRTVSDAGSSPAMPPEPGAASGDRARSAVPPGFATRCHPAHGDRRTAALVEVQQRPGQIPMGPRPQDGRRTPVASLFDRSARKIGDRRHCTRSLRTRISDGFQTGLVPEGWHTRFFCWLSALQSGDLRATKSQRSPVNLRDVGGHATPGHRIRLSYAHGNG